MKILRFVSLGAALLLPAFAPTGTWAETQAHGAKIRVLIVTGGHDFEREPFFQMFRDNPDIVWKAVEHPKAHPLLRPEAAKDFDVLLTYDLHAEISEEAKGDLLAWLRAGKGLVVLHHAIASYKDWPEYNRIIGARYYLEPKVVDGVNKPRSAYKHDVDIPVKIAQPDHPVTRGLKDFVINDETYKFYDVAEKEITPLLTTDEPLSERLIGWTKTYEKSRVVYIQLGHGHKAYENPAYRQLLKQAIEWAAGPS